MFTAIYISVNIKDKKLSSKRRILIAQKWAPLYNISGFIVLLHGCPLYIENQYQKSVVSSVLLELSRSIICQLSPHEVNI
jgi:hypothetical protein